MPAVWNYQFQLCRALIKKLVLTSIQGLVTLVVLVFLFPCLLACLVWLLMYRLFMCFRYLLVYIKPSLFFIAHVIIVENAKLFFRCMKLNFSPSFKTSLSHMCKLKVGCPVTLCKVCW